MYVDYDYYKSLCGPSAAVSETVFKNIVWVACRKIDYYTTGVDGFNKLQYAFPTDDYSAEAVKRCVCALISLINDIVSAENSIKSATGYIQKEDGTYQGKVISSISAGNESISFSSGSKDATLISKATVDNALREKLFRDTISEYLSGVTDANGVQLLYMGAYPV